MTTNEAYSRLAEMRMFSGLSEVGLRVLSRLGNKHDLGVHTEMFFDRVVDLAQAGVITNRRKRIYPGQIVTSFVTGTRRLFDFVDDNPQVAFYPCDITNDTNLLRKIEKLVAARSWPCKGWAGINSSWMPHRKQRSNDCGIASSASADHSR